MDFALAQLALVFLPGIIWSNLDAKFGSGPRPAQAILIVRAFLFGITSYIILYVIYSICGKQFAYDGLSLDSRTIDLHALKDEITFSVPVSLVAAVIWLYSVKNRWVMKTLHFLRATRRYGDEDVWSYTLNSSQPHVEYVDIRDLENGFIFSGWVNTYSENEEIREILLRDAITYDSEGNEVSRAPHLYISRRKDSMWVEFPYSGEGR